MPILFFDVDGPMVSGRALFLPENVKLRYGWKFDECAVHMLNFLNWAVKDLQVVISSHRVGMSSPFDSSCTETRRSWQRVFRENNLQLHIHNDWCTSADPLAPRKSKLEEIREWQLRNPQHANDHFVVIEDEAIYEREITEEEREQFHICAERYLDGITWSDMERMIKFLGLPGGLGDHLAKYQNYLTKRKPSNVKTETPRRYQRTVTQLAS